MDRKTALLLDVRVIDLAISYVRSGQAKFSCTALTWALSSESFKDCANKGLYEYHYLMHTRKRNGSKAPEWWNANAPFVNERIEALENFKQACIQAVKIEKVAA